VGFRDTFKIKDWRPGTGWAKGSTVAGITSYTSPWSTGAGLAPVIIADGVVQESGNVSVAQALGVPPIARAVMAYSSVISEQPLVGSVQDDTTSWLGRTDGAITPAMRNVLMFQDLFWSGHTLLTVKRDAAGYVSEAMHLPIGRWKIDEEGYVLVDDVRVDQSTVVYIPGLLPMGFLQFAAGTIRHYWAMIRTIESRSANPVPLIAIHIEEDCTLTDDEIEEVIDNWSDARKSKNGAVAVVPKGIRLEVLGEGADDGQMLTAGRNAARLDVANFVNMPGALVDGNNGTSGTYENTLQNQSEFAALSLPLFTNPIAARLSQDDVTPPGVTVRFDSSRFDSMSSPAKGNTGDATGAGPVIQGEIAA
jgi:hypothetical protein